MQNTLTVYRASAGSGKTFTLAVEYITQLLEAGAEQEFRHILAVTFTNKATAEMKDRILQQLYAIAGGLPQGEQYLRAVRSRLEERGQHLSTPQLKQKAGRALSAILHDFNHFRVETIDSFFQSVLRHLARELGLTANLEVELGDAEVISSAVDRIIDSLQHHPDIQQWVLQYVREQIEQNARWDITRAVKDFARCVFEEKFQNRSAEQRARLDNEQLIRDFRTQMRGLQQEAREQVGQAVDELLRRVDEGPLGRKGISRWNNYDGALAKMRELAYDDEETKTLRSASDEPDKMLRSADKKKPHMVAEAQALATGIAKLRHTYQIWATQAISARLAGAHINPLRLLGRIEQTAADICRENNQFLLCRTPILLGAMVGDSDAPFVFEKIGTQLSHVMIDEFQDTSHQQWNNFKVLLLENQASGGRDLVVGDVKQSIYRWRNGDWSVLHGIDTEMSHLRPRVVTLDTNYRSKEVVIGFNNWFFPIAAGELDGLAPEARFKIRDIYADVGQRCPAPDGGGYVAVRLYKRQGNKRPQDYDNRFVRDMIARIDELMALGVSQDQMAILVRKRKDGTQLIEAFRRLAPHLTLVSDEAFLLQSSVAVMMIVQALRVLADRQGLDPLPRHYLARHYLQDVLGRPATPAQFAPPEAGDCLPREFLGSQNELARLPLYVLCQRLHRIFALGRIPGQEAHLFTFFDALQAHLRSHSSDIRAFLQAWDERLCKTPVACGKTPGLRVMTIHQSKGLQFHTVLLPRCDWTIEKDQQNDPPLWCEPEEPPFDALGLLPVPAKARMQQSVFAPWYAEEHLQKRVDALNTLYVAFTRAECNLLMWGQTSGNLGKDSIAGDLIYAATNPEPDPDSEDVFFIQKGRPAGPAAKREDSGPENRMDLQAQTVAISCESHEANLNFKQSNESLRFVRGLGDEPMPGGGGDYIEMGKLIHYVLSQIQHPEDTDSVLGRCLRQGLIENEEQARRIRDHVMRGLALPQVAPWFAPDAQVVTECGILMPDGSSTRPDRVVITPGLVTVVDFKCGTPRPEHTQQVRGYMHTLSLIYPHHQVRGFLWYVYTARVHEVTREG